MPVDGGDTAEQVEGRRKCTDESPVMLLVGRYVEGCVRDSKAIGCGSVGVCVKGENSCQPFAFRRDGVWCKKRICLGDKGKKTRFLL